MGHSMYNLDKTGDPLLFAKSNIINQTVAQKKFVIRLTFESKQKI